MQNESLTPLAVCFLGILLLLTSCLTTHSQQDIEKENVITKELRLFANDLAMQIKQLSPEKPHILVVEFTDLRKKFTYLGTYVSEKLSEELSQMEGMVLVNRADIELITGELSFQQSGMVSDEDIIRIGEFLGANILISGTITDLGDEIDISAKITNIITSEISPISFRMLKTKDKMALISAITIVEEEKEKELNDLIKQLQSEIDLRKQELVRLMTTGAEEIAAKLQEEEDLKRQELADYYEQRLKEIKSAIRLEEQQKGRQLALVEQQLREKSELLATLREKEKELEWYDTEIGEIYARIARQNSAVEHYVTNGMTPDEVAKVLGIPEVYITVDISGPWYKTLNVATISSHGDYVIAWSGMSDNAIVLGYCNRKTGKCDRRWVGD